ncbi:Astacin-like metalloendopeptidase [Strongyloides ratti]|uniref:Metalloendopeptidase n=1 Tax=Strongyloides ratti TaxID=34506 RepID=A0A090N0F8_STRRB|nr:Astacin-like metalloendopeptidase [Strongyloides ratti]CEF70612.1 Astacin-like metalloendopeptidase [Strongyloides ratti]
MIFFKYFLLYIIFNNFIKYIVNKNINNINFSSIRTKRKVIGEVIYKWTLPIPYYVDKNLDHNLIKIALNEIEYNTCIRFRQMNEMIDGISGIQYYFGNTCSSKVGRVLGKIWQRISIGDDCNEKGRIQHETLHALGIDHEHSRYDRHNFIYLIEKNVADEYKHNFLVVSEINSNTFNIPYDYGSIMHYDMYSFSKNGNPTMIPKDELYKTTIGHVHSFSFNDIKTVNLYYCAKKCSVKIYCFNGGYQNPNKCNTCICIEGFVGYNCRYFQKSKNFCGITTFIAHKISKEIKNGGNKYCIYHIKTLKRYKIGIKLNFVNIQTVEKKICEPDNSLEIKYWEDKTVTGARFCGIIIGTTFISKNDYVIIYFRSNNMGSNFKITFKRI